MSESSPRMQWPYPTREDDPWYDFFRDYINAADASAYAAREDASIIWTGGGTVSWDASTGTLDWTDAISIYSPIGSRLIQIAASSLASIADGETVYVVLTRQPLANISASLAKASQLPSNENSRSFAVRIGDVIYFRTGMSLGDGDSSDGIAPVPGGGGGGGAGSYLDIGGDYSYTEAAVPVEETIGQITFDGSLVTAATFRVTITTSLTVGNATIKLYDNGPVGAPAPPRTVATLVTAVSGGPQMLSQVLTQNSPAGANQFEPANHFYEVVVTSAAVVGDTVYVGNARIEA